MNQQNSVLRKMLNIFEKLIPYKITKKTLFLHSDYPHFYTKDNLEYLLNCNDIRIYEHLFRNRKDRKKIDVNSFSKDTKILVNSLYNKIEKVLSIPPSLIIFDLYDKETYTLENIQKVIDELKEDIYTEEIFIFIIKFCKFETFTLRGWFTDRISNDKELLEKILLLQELIFDLSVSKYRDHHIKIS